MKNMERCFRMILGLSLQLRKKGDEKIENIRFSECGFFGEKLHFSHITNL